MRRPPVSVACRDSGNSPAAIQTTMHIQQHHYASKLELTIWLQSQDGQMAASGRQTDDCSSSCRDTPSCRHLLAGAPAYAKATAKQAEDPKSFDLAPSRDSVYLIPLRAYLVMHAHVLLNLPLRRRARQSVLLVLLSYSSYCLSYCPTRPTASTRRSHPQTRPSPPARKIYTSRLLGRTRTLYPIPAIGFKHETRFLEVSRHW